MSSIQGNAKLAEKEAIPEWFSTRAVRQYLEESAREMYRVYILQRRSAGKRTRLLAEKQLLDRRLETATDKYMIRQLEATLEDVATEVTDADAQIDHYAAITDVHEEEMKELALWKDELFIRERDLEGDLRICKGGEEEDDLDVRAKRFLDMKQRKAVLMRAHASMG